MNTLDFSEDEYKTAYDKITEKSCTCVGLGTSALLAYNLDTKTEGKGVSICPGPNMAYFSKLMTPYEIIDHIYGRSNVASMENRPNMFIKELLLYLDYLKKQIDETWKNVTERQKKYLLTFAKNLEEGINYYHDIFNNLEEGFNEIKCQTLHLLEQKSKALQLLGKKIGQL